MSLTDDVNNAAVKAQCPKCKSLDKCCWVPVINHEGKVQYVKPAKKLHKARVHAARAQGFMVEVDARIEAVRARIAAQRNTRATPEEMDAWRTAGSLP